MHSRSSWLAVVSCLSFLVSSAAAQLAAPAVPTPTPPLANAAAPQMSIPPLPNPTIRPLPPVPSPTPVPTNPPPVNPDQSIPVAVSYGQGVETRVQIYRGIMEPVGIPPNQPVTVTLFLASGLPGTLVQLGLYDGGQVGPPALPGQDIVNSIGSSISLPPWPGPTVSTNGTLQFNFQSAPLFGLYRVLVTIGPKQYLLQFYAVRPRSVPPLPGITISPPPGPSPPNTPPPG